ncbi:MAG: mycothiol system anti-sigma-R factor [Actinomycetota bacterium]
MNCREMLEVIYAYLDGEADSASVAEVERHLDECAPCLRYIGLEKEIKALVRRCCKQPPAESDLDRMKLRIRQALDDKG